MAGPRDTTALEVDRGDWSHLNASLYNLGSSQKVPGRPSTEVGVRGLRSDNGPAIVVWNEVLSQDAGPVSETGIRQVSFLTSKAIPYTSKYALSCALVLTQYT